MSRRRYATRMPPPPRVAEPHDERELAAVREIVHAFLHADRSDDVFQFALDRISPIVGAPFSSVYLSDGASDLMRLVAAHKWPDRLRERLTAIRIRVGSGPSGEAASERRAIEVPDILRDADLHEWHELARDLGLRALVAIPLQTPRGVVGTVNFHFADLGVVTTATRSLLRIVADHMAATAEKATISDELRRTNAALVEATAELERQYVAVVEARRSKDEFLANVSYELRAPLSTVVGNLSLLREHVSGPLTEEQDAELAEASRASEVLLSLIDTLLEFSALRRGSLEVRLEEFDPRDPLRDALHSAKGRAEGVQLLAEESVHAVPIMRSDRKKVTRILVNLLTNAFKFTETGEVRVSMEITNGRVMYRVQDTGIGIEPASQLMIFEGFRHVEGGGTRRYGGSGLGLALSRGIAHLLGGDVELASAPGEGSTFTLSLPLLSEPVHPKPIP